ncbi:MAG: conjugal transfer protein TraD [Candidatus Kuenenia stuttgartiensis]|nr:conjugal transfer protein TraD [Candidatus Kuenenia stuttgartiensis]
METVIVICLLIIIVLLLQDKVVIKWKPKQRPKQEKTNPNLPDIMGQPKPIRYRSTPNTASASHIEESEINPDNLDIEYDESENVGIQIPQEELDEVFKDVPDLAEEEEEWNRYRTASDDNGLAQGVTIEELYSVGALLQKEKLDPAQKETAADVVQRIHGTDLISLLESSVEDASRKIAELLDSTLSSSETDSGSSSLRKNDLEDFDIGEFV